VEFWERCVFCRGASRGENLRPVGTPPVQHLDACKFFFKSHNTMMMLSSRRLAHIRHHKKLFFRFTEYMRRKRSDCLLFFSLPSMKLYFYYIIMIQRQNLLCSIPTRAGGIGGVLVVRLGLHPPLFQSSSWRDWRNLGDLCPDLAMLSGISSSSSSPPPPPPLVCSSWS
jgi:hypothetical protein